LSPQSLTKNQPEIIVRNENDMTEYSICKKFNMSPVKSKKAVSVMRMFGLTAGKLRQAQITHSCQLEINKGDIVYITGPSGSGKSVILKELEKTISACDRINLEQIELACDRAVIDCIEADYLQSLRILNTAGLNDVFCVLNRPVHLSDGQKWRFRLAMAMASKAEFIFADEFCSQLDRITAAVISCNIQRYAKKHKVTFILAGAAEDILADLAADVLVVKELSGPTNVIYKS